MTSSRVEAELRLKEYLDRVGELCRRRDELPDEVVEGLRAHVEAELARMDGGVWTLPNMERVLSRLGTPEEVVGPDAGRPSALPVRAPVAEEEPSDPFEFRSSRAIWIYAIVLPLIAIGFESVIGLMATFYLDPMPTWLHVAGLLLLVFAVWMAEHGLRHRDFLKRHSRAIFLLNGYALALSTIYFIVYVPTLPISAIGILGIVGLLGFSPMACMLASLFQCRYLRRNRPGSLSRSQARRLALGGLALAMGLLAIGNGPDIVRGHALNQATLDDPDLRARGLDVLELIGGEPFVLRACYVQPRNLGSGGLAIGPLRHVFALLAPPAPPVEASRRVYYELTGDLYNGVPAPRIKRLWRGEDAGLGGSEVAGNVRGLAMTGSQFNVQVEYPESPTAYIEWVMEFEKRDASGEPGEARVQIMLPHGGVVSRLTLWIDGEERESAVGRRQQVREAYQSVAVVQRRDPALVSYVGPDRVLLQVFPVTPGAPPMKVKLGVSAPLVFRNGKAWLRLPHIVERNLVYAKNLEHALWADAPVALNGASEARAEEAAADGSFSLRASLDSDSLSDSARGAIWFDAAPPFTTYHARHEDFEAALEMTPPEKAAPAEVILVVDGSKSMANASIDWAKALEAVPAGVGLRAFYSGRVVVRWAGASPAELAAWLEEKGTGGGPNPVAALEAAFEEAQKASTVIVWVHGPQPVTLPRTQSLEQWAAHSTAKFIEVQAVPGPNRLVERLDHALREQTAPLLGPATDTLRYVLQNVTVEDVQKHYRISHSDEASPSTRAETSDSANKRPNVVRLAIADAVNRAGLSERPRLAKLAADARLVTAATSAVVLQNQAQYDAHNLDASANSEWIPAVPEPEEWALIAVAALCVAFMAYRKRRQALQG